MKWIGPSTDHCKTNFSEHGQHIINMYKVKSI